MISMSNSLFIILRLYGIISVSVMLTAVTILTIQTIDVLQLPSFDWNNVYVVVFGLIVTTLIIVFYVLIKDLKYNYKNEQLI